MIVYLIDKNKCFLHTLYFMIIFMNKILKSEIIKVYHEKVSILEVVFWVLYTQKKI